jgi:electron transfer flavoprotein beta subunit
MNILVCVKQVPDTTEIKIDPETNTLIRAGVPSILNPFDEFAMEVAARIKDENPGETTITALSMGPEQAKAVLRDCLAMGADRSYLVSDRVFGGSDTLATSYILSGAIKYLEEKDGQFDLILCGKQAIDGDTAQVGPEVAEHLARPQLTYAVEVRTDAGRTSVKKETEDGYEVYEIALPAVISITKTSFDPRMPSIKSKLAARKAEIPLITFADLMLDPGKVGLKGSPTKVKRTFTPQHNKNGIRIEEQYAKDAASKLAGLLKEASLI